MAEIPLNAAAVVPATEELGRQDQEKRDFESLETENALRKLLRREVGQRYWLRWIAVATGTLVILGMAALLTHLVHRTFWGPFHFASPAFSVAMIVAPIASITAIKVALFVGAFRKFEDKDMETVGNGASGAFNMFRGS